MVATQVAADEESEEKDNNKTSWEQLLRRMLPPGAPLPDEDHLDYSIAVEYQGPALCHPVPKVDPLNFDDSSSVATSSIVGSPVKSFSESTSGSSNVISKMMATSRFHPNGNAAKEVESNLNGSGQCSIDDWESNCNSNSLFSLELRSENLELRREEIVSNPNSDSRFDLRSSSVGGEREVGNVYNNENEHVSEKDSLNEKEDEDENESEISLIEGRRAIRVTINSDVFDEDEQSSHCSSVQEAAASPVVNGEKKRWRKRGVCSRCGKGNRLSEREMCVVCDAKYCKNCVLKAMGSMPEGRKCLSCIGKVIDESKRALLGKCTKILWKVCSALEVNQIMKAEKECFANQLRPEQLVVNGRQMVMEELVQLFGCLLPPRNLKPGRYWYDKDSGLWGKEGEQPDRIISSTLNVGGKLQPDASKGNTRVFINGREITKVELSMLKLAKVQCPRDTHFWVYDDGSYEEEGQNNIKGNIWRKKSTRFLCSLLSLPLPPGKLDGSKDDCTRSSGLLGPEYLDQGRIQKLLLLGLGGSGTSTIFKQAKFLYGGKFTLEELEDIKFMIQSNLYKYLGVLLEVRESFEEETLAKEKDTEGVAGDDVELYPGKVSSSEKKPSIYSINPRLKKHADWLLEIIATGDLDAFFPAATREYAPLVEELWRDRAIQETYKRKEELHLLPGAVKYFLERAVEISSNDYEPTEKDILYAEGVTQSNGIASVEFSFSDRSAMSDIYDENLDHLPPTKYQLIRLNPSGLQDGCKWLEMFEDVRAVIYSVALSDYDVMWAEATESLYNKMLASKDLFESLVKRPSFRGIPFVLLLNKYDAFEEKISMVPLTVCEWFRDFCPVNPHCNSQSLAHQAYYYVAVKFKELYAAISGRKLYVWQTRGLERTSVDEAFKFVREVLKWDEDKIENMYGLTGDDSFYSTVVSSCTRQD